MENSSDSDSELVRCACENDAVYRIFFQVTGWVLPVPLVCHLPKRVVEDNTENHCYRDRKLILTLIVLAQFMASMLAFFQRGNESLGS
jgi:hypothetical protein